MTETKLYFIDMDSNEGAPSGSQPSRLNQVEGGRTTSNDGRSTEDRPSDVIVGFKQAQQEDAHAFLGDIISRVTAKYGDVLPPNLTDHNVIAQRMFGDTSVENTMPVATPVSAETAEAIAEGSMTPVDAVAEHQRIQAQHQAGTANPDQPRIVPVDLAHPYGPSAATGALPMVRINPAETTFYHREIPAGYDQDRLAAETERVLKVAEGTESLLSHEYVANWVTLYNGYELAGTYIPVFDPLRGRDKTKEEFLIDLGRKVAVRGGLALAELNINNRQFEVFANAAKGVLWKENIGVLLTDTLGTTERVFENAGRIMNEKAAGDLNKGSYWRETADPLTGAYPPGSKHVAVDDYLNKVVGLSDADKRVVKKTMERLYKVTGMVTYYTGPIVPTLPDVPPGDPRNENAGRLMDEVIMEEIDYDTAADYIKKSIPQQKRVSDPTSPDYNVADPAYNPKLDSSAVAVYDPDFVSRLTPRNPLYDSRLIPRSFSENRYMKNEEYWKKWAKARKDAPPMSRASDGATALGTFPTPKSSDPTPMRRIFYNPEHQLGERNKASDLLGSSELYVRSFLHYSGMNDMDDFFDVTLTPSEGPAMGVPPVRAGGAVARLRNSDGRTVDEYSYNVGRWAGQVSGAEKALSKMNDFLNEPVSKEAAEGDLGKGLKNMLDVVQAFDGYLKAGNPAILYFGCANLVEATFNYANGDSSSRKKEFPKMPRFKRETMNAVFNYLSDKIDLAHRKEALEKLGASDKTVNTIKGVKEVGGLFGDFFGILGGMLKSDLSGR